MNRYKCVTILAAMTLCASSAFALEPVTLEGNRAYTERVHGYAHGNSLGIQSLDRRQKLDRADINANTTAIAGKVDTTTFVKDQARQDARANQADLGIEETRAVNAVQTTRLNGHDAQLANLNDALDTQLGGAYQRIDHNSSRIDRLERQSERAAEASAIGLAVAGHQFDTKGGFQTAISASTVGGKQAIALGAGGAINDRVFVNAGVSTSGGTTGGVVSSTLSW